LGEQGNRGRPRVLFKENGNCDLEVDGEVVLVARKVKGIYVVDRAENASSPKVVQKGPLSEMEREGAAPEKDACFLVKKPETADLPRTKLPEHRIQKAYDTHCSLARSYSTRSPNRAGLPSSAHFSCRANCSSPAIARSPSLSATARNASAVSATCWAHASAVDHASISGPGGLCESSPQREGSVSRVGEERGRGWGGVVVEGVVGERLEESLEGLDFAFFQCAVPVGK
ncbi:hypothetical protein KFL_012630010, partial [Klebsormidium nitens]